MKKLKYGQQIGQNQNNMSGLRMKIRKKIGYEINPSFNEIIIQKTIDFNMDELYLTGS